LGLGSGTNAPGGQALATIDPRVERAINAGYTWDTMWNPRLGLKAGATSGDDNPNDRHLGTFDALFFKSGYFNDASLIRPQNFISVHPELYVHPLQKVTIDGGASPIWRYSRNDAVYAVPDPSGFPRATMFQLRRNGIRCEHDVGA